MTIVTLTLNPSMDRTFELEELERGATLRATWTGVDAGGKGVNVARALAANQHQVRAVLPVGGPEGEHLADLLEGLGVDTELIPVSQPVRTNVSLVEPDGTVTKVNATGPELSGSELEALQQAAVGVAGARWVAACGSLPPGAGEDTYARLTELVHEHGARVAVDTSGAALAACVHAAPEVLKPNRDELAEAAGALLRRFGDVVEAAQQLLERGAGSVLVSLGSDGAVLVDERGAVHADTSPLSARSNVGAGDATIAGFLAAGGHGPEALARAVAWGAAAVRLPGTAMPGPDDIDRDEVALHDVDPDRPLAR